MLSPLPVRRRRLAAATLALVLAIGGCGRSDGDPPAAEAGPAGASPAAAGTPAGPAPISVTTVRAERRAMPIGLEATGTVVAVASVDVKPQVSSVVKTVHVRDGQFVRAGDPLFTLDARADEANLARLVAQRARDQASLDDARRQLARNVELVERGFVSQAVVDASRSQVDAQAAAVGASRAAIDAARVPVGQSRIVAPAGGRVGAVGAWPGSAVVASQTTLVTVTQIDPIDVAFPVPQRHLQDVLGALRGGRTTVTVALPDGTTRLAGRLVFVDSAIDAASGTVRVKARFDNPDSLLWPGAFVRASLDFAGIEDAVVVPQAAVIRGPRGTLVYVVVDGRAVARPVEVLASRGEDAAVRGVEAGDAVVLDGRQNLRPDAPVVEQPGAPGGGSEGGPGGTPGGTPGSTPGNSPGSTPGTGPGAGPGLVRADPPSDPPAVPR